MAKWAGIVATMAVLTLVHTARAEPPSDQDRAVVLFHTAETAYTEGRFQEAVSLLKQAYDLAHDPVLLFNLGTAEEGLRDYRAAITAYKGYLQGAPDAHDKDSVAIRIKTLEDLIAASPKPIVMPWVIGVPGVLTLGAAGVVGALALDKHNDALNEPVQTTARDAQDTAASFATVSNVLFVVGGVLVATGVTWLIAQVAGRGKAQKSTALTSLSFEF